MMVVWWNLPDFEFTSFDGLLSVKKGLDKQLQGRQLVQSVFWTIS